MITKEDIAKDILESVFCESEFKFNVFGDVSGLYKNLDEWSTFSYRNEFVALYPHREMGVDGYAEVNSRHDVLGSEHINHHMKFRFDKFYSDEYLLATMNEHYHKIHLHGQWLNSMRDSEFADIFSHIVKQAKLDLVRRKYNV